MSDTHFITSMRDLSPSKAFQINSGKNQVHMEEFKEIAKKCVPNSLLTQLILAEPSTLSRREILAKLEDFIRLLYSEVSQEKVFH